MKSVDWRLRATSIAVIYYYYFLGLGKIIFHSVEKTLLSSLWNESIFSLSDAELLYHHICTNVRALTSLTVKSPAWSPNRIMASAAVGQDRCKLVSPHLHPLKTSLCWVFGLATARGCWILVVCAMGCMPKAVLYRKVKHISTCDCLNYGFQSLLILEVPGCPPNPSHPRHRHVHTCWRVLWSFSLTFSITVVSKQVWAPSSRRTHKIPGSLLYSWRFSN